MNTDASFDKVKNVAQAGIIFRDYKGEMIGGHTRRIPAISPLTAKALAVREALALANNCNMGRVIIELDCQELIRACRNENQIGEIMCIVQDIKSIKRENPNLGLSWTPREGNNVAHLIAVWEVETLSLGTGPASLHRLFLLSSQMTKDKPMCECILIPDLLRL